MTSPPKRVLYVETNDDDTVGGSHQALFDLATGLDRSRYEPVVIFYRENHFLPRLREAGVEAHEMESTRVRERSQYQSRGRIGRALTALGGVRSRASFIRRYHIDLVHVISSPRITYDDWLPAARITGVPCIASDMLVESMANPRGLRRWLMSGFDHVLPVSGHQERILRRLGLPCKKITRVYHGVDVEALVSQARQPPAITRREIGVSEDHLMVAMVANVREWKGQHILLEALAQLPSPALQRIRTVFAGALPPKGDEYMSRLDALVRKHGLHEQVQFLGFRNDVPNLLMAADIVVHASTEPEPGGVLVLEALALGRPVIASCLGGHAEVMLPDAGLVFDPSSPTELSQHLTLLIEDAELRKELARTARSRMEDFTIRRNVAETQAIYREILGT